MFQVSLVQVDIVINNASALWWHDITDTPMSKFDLIVGINARGSFALTRACLPYMERQGWGRVISMSPPISTDYSVYGGHTAYNISKMGMTMVAMGVAAEYKGKNITGNSLWPATIIESLASQNFKMGERQLWRKADIIADATAAIICDDGSLTGNMLFDDVYLRSKGLQDEDFVKYRCDPDVEPPRLLAEANPASFVRRGQVDRLDQDLHSAKL
mmetsp:Transcript_58618/g.138043  ORF Transcript_58618/g.138043 Transcript_58618/m.138043 type:complete len:215 (+) Transcript_58618:317-961(+)